jgi:hypothetical protein
MAQAPGFSGFLLLRTAGLGTMALAFTWLRSENLLMVAIGAAAVNNRQLPAPANEAGMTL